MVIVPLFPVFGWLLAGGGGCLLWWFSTMNPQQQDRANRLATEIASELFDKTLGFLTTDQAARVWQQVRRQMLGC